MVDLVPVPFAVLISRLLRELSQKQAAFNLPRWKFAAGDPALDLSLAIHGRKASTPFGPAAGPHTQLAQNILLSWLAGGRVIELKTVQIRDRLEIARPCIDMDTVGFNIEWSQELALAQSLEEYVKAAMLITIAKAEGLAPALPDTVFDMSVGYDLAGISSPPLRAFLDGMGEAGAVVERLKAEIPDRYARLRALAYPTRLSDSVTLSTFHGCPPGEIERIGEYLMGESGLNLVVKLNPTLLGKADLEAILHNRLGYPELRVPEATFAKDASWDEITGIVARLGALAERLGRSFGVKFTNTLLIENHRDVFPESAREMYMSGPPLHVLAMTLVKRFRDHFGDRFPISFSAGIDAGNFPDAVALGLKPVSVCTDLLKAGGYGRGADHIAALCDRMRASGAGDIDGFTLAAFGEAEAALADADLPAEVREGCRTALADGTDLRAAAGEYFDAWVSAARLRNTDRYLEKLEGERRYARDGFAAAPRKSGIALGLLDCETCGKCVAVCPNAALFRFALPKAPIPLGRVVAAGDSLCEEATGALVPARAQQIGLYADACNQCGNCDVICPETGAPHAVKAAFFGARESFQAAPERDGFLIESVGDGQRVLARQGGTLATLDIAADGALRYRGDGFDLAVSGPGRNATVTGRADAPVDVGRMRLHLALVEAVTADDAVNFVSAALS